MGEFTNDSHTWAHLWQGAGWQASNVDVPGQKLVFIKSGAVHPKLTPKQLRILQYLSSAIGWTTRKQMEDTAGPKGFSKALGAPTHGEPDAGTLEALGLVERADGPPPFSYRITALGRTTAEGLRESQDATSPAHTALVLTENELYTGQDFGWKDETGKQYQFPNAAHLKKRSHCSLAKTDEASPRRLDMRRALLDLALSLRGGPRYSADRFPRKYLEPPARHLSFSSRPLRA